MKSLLLKDLLTLKGQGRTLLLVFAVWFILSCINGSGVFFMALSTMYPMLLPITAIAADEKCGFERYAMTMPLTRNALALSRYVLGLICAVCIGAAGIACALLIGDEPGEAFIYAAACFCLGLMLMGVALPLVYRFGVEKARLTMTVTFVVFFLLIGFAAGKLGIDLEAASGAFLLLPVITLLVLAVSAFVSLRIYSKREF